MKNVENESALMRDAVLASINAMGDASRQYAPYKKRAFYRACVLAELIDKKGYGHYNGLQRVHFKLDEDESYSVIVEIVDESLGGNGSWFGYTVSWKDFCLTDEEFEKKYGRFVQRKGEDT